VLEAARGVGHSEEHDLQFEKSLLCLESAFPFITFLDTDVVVAPSDVEFAEYFHSLQVFNALCKVREWGDIFAGDSIEGAIVDDVSLLL